MRGDVRCAKYDELGNLIVSSHFALRTLHLFLVFGCHHLLQRSTEHEQNTCGDAGHDDEDHEELIQVSDFITEHGWPYLVGSGFAWWDESAQGAGKLVGGRVAQEPSSHK